MQAGDGGWKKGQLARQVSEAEANELLLKLLVSLRNTTHTLGPASPNAQAARQIIREFLNQMIEAGWAVDRETMALTRDSITGTQMQSSVVKEQEGMDVDADEVGGLIETLLAGLRLE